MIKRALLVLAFGVVLVGCSAPKKRYWGRPERSVAVMPPFHVKPVAWQATWPHVEREMARRGFTVIPHEEVEGWFLGKKFSIPKELTQYTTEELAKELKADMILYTHIEEWDKTTLLLYNKIKVKVRAQLYSADGTLLYDRSGWASQKRNMSVAGIMLKPNKLAWKAVRNAMWRLLSVPPPTAQPNTPPDETSKDTPPS